MVQKGWSERDAVASLAAMIAQILLEGGSDGESLAVHIQQLARQYTRRPSPSVEGKPGDNRGIEFHLPDGAKLEAAQQVGEVLDRLYPSPDQETFRYKATRHVIGQVLAVMMIRGVPDPDAIQTIVAAVMELLADGLGHTGAAEHFRRMADAMERDAPLKQ
jgi:hypothetical protein